MSISSLQLREYLFPRESVLPSPCQLFNVILTMQCKLSKQFEAKHRSYISYKEQKTYLSGSAFNHSFSKLFFKA